MKRIVIDASVILKWYLPDEKYGQKSIGLLDKYITGELDFIAPSLLEYEVMNGLMVAQRKGRIQKEKIRTAIDGFISLGIKMKNITNIYPSVLYFCTVFDCSVYDASYLALAEEEDMSMVTADERLNNTVKNKLKWVIWIGNV